jgi:hypothetical protein
MARQVGQHLGGDLVELADMPEREGPQKAA